MDETVTSPLQAWESFYVIVGSSAGALTGLQFVVLTLISEAGMIHAGLRLSRVSSDALYIVGGATLLLVFVGIHNAWDTVTYVTLQRAREHKARGAARGTAERQPPSGTAPGERRNVEASGPPAPRNPEA